MSTYTPIASQSLSSATLSVTFSSIPSGYTDLVLVINGSMSGTGYYVLRVNNDSSTKYSRAYLQGNGSSVTSGRNTNDSNTYGTFGSANKGISIWNFMNYASTTTFKTMLSTDTDESSGVILTSSLYRSYDAINQINLVGASNFNSGTTFNLYGIQAGNALATKATGGNRIISSGGYWYHVFTSSGTFTPTETISCDYLVVAGGGAGGKIYGGGGGGGGFRSATSQSLTAQNYPVIVGAGGAVVNVNWSVGGNGGNSSFNGLESAGGGGGASDQVAGASGGSGGGGGYRENPNSGGPGGISSPVTSPVQGYAGGSGGKYYGTVGVSGGGGGGAGGQGAEGVYSNGAGGSAMGGSGSNAFSSWASATQTGVSGFYAGGGGGGRDTSSAGGGGNGGGGAGSGNGGGTPGTPNTGGGGGGGYNVAPTGSGGSGIVIVRYAV